MRVPYFVLVCSLLVFMTSGSDARSRSDRNGRMVNTVKSNDVKEVSITLGSRENLESLRQEYDAMLINYQKTKYQLQLVQAEYSLLKLQNGRNADSKNKDLSVKSEDADWCPYATDCYLPETHEACPKKCPEDWCMYLEEHNDLKKDCSYKESQERCPTLCAKFSVAEKKVADAKWCKKAKNSGCKGKRMLKKCPNKCAAIKEQSPEPTAAPAPEPECIGLSCLGIDDEVDEVWCKNLPAYSSCTKSKKYVMPKCPKKCAELKGQAPEPTAAPAPEPECIGLSCLGIDGVGIMKR